MEGALHSSSPASAVQLPAHPFQADPHDHCETPPEAYAHLAPVLRAIAAAALGRRGDDAASSSLAVYDPYFCAGSAARHLAAVGFPTVINRNEDFYAAVDAGAVPAHDVVVTNPPFSGDHVERLLRWAVARHSPGVVADVLRAGSSSSGGGGARAGTKRAPPAGVATGGPEKRRAVLTGVQPPSAAVAGGGGRLVNTFAALADSDSDDDSVNGAGGGDDDQAADGGGVLEPAAAYSANDGVAPWCALLPHYIANKPYFHVLRAALAADYEGRGWGGQPLLYVGPAGAAYAFTAPAGARPAAPADGERQALAASEPLSSAASSAAAQSAVPAGSFQCVWFVGGLGHATGAVAAALGLGPPPPSHQQAGSDSGGNDDEEDTAGKAPVTAPLAGGAALLAWDAGELPQLAPAAGRPRPSERRWRRRKQAGAPGGDGGSGGGRAGGRPRG